jgi:ABC-type lipoprotein release transport system permease subunit
MSTLKLLVAEIRYRKLNFALSLLAVMMAVTLFVAGTMVVENHAREVRWEVAKLEGHVDKLQESVNHAADRVAGATERAAATRDRVSAARLQAERSRDQVAEMEEMVAESEQALADFKQRATTELDELEKETRRLMKDLGFNLMIVHQDTNMSDFWASDFAAEDMPQEYVDRLAGDPRLTLVTHLVATLQQRITWEDRKVLLVGYLPEATQSHMRKKPPMGYDIAPGTAFLGHELGVGREVDQTVNVLGKDLKIARILPEQGSKEDITIAMHLNDAQAILEKPERVNQIMALGCHCAGSDLPNIRKQLADVLPDTRITEFRSRALARAEQRDLVEQKRAEVLGRLEEKVAGAIQAREDAEALLAKADETLKGDQARLDQEERAVEQEQAKLAQEKVSLAEQTSRLAQTAESGQRFQKNIEFLVAVVSPLVMLACAVWVGLLALANVRERRTEIGILRALGKGSGTIAGLFLGKALLLGLLGALLGFALGSAVAEILQGRVVQAAAPFAVRFDVLLYALLVAPVLSVVASYLPTLKALMQDPALVLRNA